MDKSEQARLEALSKYEILDSPTDPAFDDLTSLAAQSFDAPVSLISFVDGEREWIKSEVGTTVREIPRDRAFANQAIRARDVFIVSDGEVETGLRDNPFVTDEPHARFFVGFPLINKEGVALGALYVLDRMPHEVTEQQRQTLRRLGHEAVMLLEFRREMRELRERNAQLRVELHDLQKRLESKATDHDRVEDQLKNSERQLADAQRIADLGSWEWDLRTNKISWSDELYRIYGLKPREGDTTYETYLRFVHPEDRARVNHAVERALFTRGDFKTEERITRADGEVRILYTCGEVIRDEKGDPVRMVGCCQDITERKEIENQLQHSLSLLNATIEATADGLLVVDSEQRIIQFNQKFAELWHVPPEIASMYDDTRLLNVVGEQLKDGAAFQRRIQEIYGNPECESFDTLEFKDGRMFERYSCPQYLGDKVVGRVWSFRDITERERALAILRLSEERYRSLSAATAQVVWSANTRGEVMEDTPSWRKFTGQTYAQLRGFGWLDAVHPRDRARVFEIWTHSIKTGKVYEIEFRVRHADGEWRDMSVRGVPVREPDGAIREWVGYCKDITQRKHATEEVMKERDFSNALISSLPGIFYLLDETGLNLRWNENMEKVSGYSALEISHMHAIDFVPPDEREILSRRVRKVFTTGEADVDLNILTKSGEKVPYYCTGRLVHIDGRPCLTGVGIDVSRMKGAEAEVRKLNTELEQRVAERTAQLNETNKEMAAFTYTASHDLRSPIRAITGFARAIREDAGERLEDESRLYLDRIIQASDRMMQLIDDLLRYCRVGQQTTYSRPVAMQELITEIVQEFEPRFKTIGAEVAVAPDLPRVMGDPTLLFQIFDNLVENAIVYRKQHEPLRLNVSWRNGVNDVVVFVQDNGIGIAPQHHQRIFEVFQRLHAVEAYPGTGVGLATVKRSVEKLGGSVWVESELGMGSVFCVRLQKAENGNAS